MTETGVLLLSPRQYSRTGWNQPKHTNTLANCIAFTNYAVCIRFLHSPTRHYVKICGTWLDIGQAIWPSPCTQMNGNKNTKAVCVCVSVAQAIRRNSTARLTANCVRICGKVTPFEGWIYLSTEVILFDMWMTDSRKAFVFSKQMNWVGFHENWFSFLVYIIYNIQYTRIYIYMGYFGSTWIMRRRVIKYSTIPWKKSNIYLYYQQREFKIKLPALKNCWRIGSVLRPNWY